MHHDCYIYTVYSTFSEHINISFWICPLKFLVAILILFCIILIWVGHQTIIIKSSPLHQVHKKCMLLSIPVVILFLFFFHFLNLYRTILSTDAIGSVVRNVCFAITFWLLCDFTSIKRVLNVMKVLCFDRVFIPITHNTRR